MPSHRKYRRVVQYLIHNRSPNWWRFVMDCDDPSCLPVCDVHLYRWSCAVLHTYMIVRGIIILERGILLHFKSFDCLFECVVCGSSRSVANRHSFCHPLRIRCIGHIWNIVDNTNSGSRVRTKHKLNPLVMLGPPRVKSWPQWWESSALVTTPSLLPCCWIKMCN